MNKIPLTPIQLLRKRIESLFPLVPQRKGWRAPEYVELNRAKYRGKIRWLAGYSHSRMYAHFMRGLTHKRIVGYGDTPEAAVDAMEAKLKAKKAQPIS